MGWGGSVLVPWLILDPTPWNPLKPRPCLLLAQVRSPIVTLSQTLMLHLLHIHVRPRCGSCRLALRWSALVVQSQVNPWSSAGIPPGSLIQRRRMATDRVSEFPVKFVPTDDQNNELFAILVHFVHF